LVLGGFLYLWKLYDLFLRTDADGSRALGSFLLVGVASAGSNVPGIGAVSERVCLSSAGREGSRMTTAAGRKVLTAMRARRPPIDQPHRTV
jgi:hypothetical protein